MAITKKPNKIGDFLVRFKFPLILIAVGFLLYFNAIFNSFVWDDFDQVVRNTAVHSISNIQYFFSGSTFYSGGGEKLIGLYYKPLMPLFFALIYSIFGPNPSAFHLFQITLHIANSVLLLLFLKNLFKKEIAFFASLLFLVHPINTEAVVYISALQDTLYFFFGILSLNLIQFKSKRSTILIFLFFLCSILSKETGLLFILISTVYAFLYQRKQFKKVLIVAILVLLTYAILRFGIAQVFYHKIGLAPIIRASAEERLLTIPKTIFYYLKTFVFPLNLAISQHWLVRSMDMSSFIVPLSIVGAFFIILLNLGYFFRKTLLKPFIFFLVWLLLGLGLNSNLIPLDMTVADRWFYFPFVGLVGLIAILLNQIKIKGQYLKFNLLVLLIIIISLFSLRTFLRTIDWKDIQSLYSHDIKYNQDSFDLENNYGVALYRISDYDQAKVHFEKSIALAPYWYTSWHNLGLIYERDKKIDKAREAYQKSIELSGGAYFGYISLARLTLIYGDPKEAKKTAELALKRYSKNPELWQILSLAESKLNNRDEAIKAAQNSYNLLPDRKAAFILENLTNDKPINLQEIYFFK